MRDGVFKTELGKQIDLRCEEQKITGGIIAYVGDPGNDLLSDLAGIAERSFLVRGLLPGSADLDNARKVLLEENRYGNISLDHRTCPALPFIQNLVNVLIVDGSADVSRDEILRVLTPRGFAMVRHGDHWDIIEKSRPQEYDDWTHYLYDASNNAVSNDLAVRPPLGQVQWVGSPSWTRNHDHMSSFTSCVASAGRLFYIMDEGPRFSVLCEPEWSVVARDAFNGVILWKRPIEEWQSHLISLKSGPASLTRRMACDDSHLWVTLGVQAAVSKLAAETGESLHVYPGTEGTEEILICGSYLVFVTGTGPEITIPGDRDYEKDDRRSGGFDIVQLNRHPKRVQVFDLKSDRLLWTQDEDWIAPHGIAAKGEAVYLFDGNAMKSYNLSDGRSLWQSEPLPYIQRDFNFFAPKLIVYDETVLFAGGEDYSPHISSNGLMTALSAKTGEKLWQGPTHRSGYQSPEDLFVIDGVVWDGDICLPDGHEVEGDDSFEGEFTGWDIKTGEVKVSLIHDPDQIWFHHRCHQSKATTNYLLTSRYGIEFIDVRDQTWTSHNWTRGACLYGIFPANGMIYAPPHSCACAINTKTNGFTVLAPVDDPGTPEITSTEPRLIRGNGRPDAAVGAAGTKEDEGAWPTYRFDNSRSSFVPVKSPDKPALKWQVKLPGEISSLTVAGDLVYGAMPDAHTVFALEAESGKMAWQYTCGSRVDSPPTLYKGRAVFGSADGNIYALSARTGELIWKYRAAPSTLMHPSFEQLESTHPLHGSVLIADGSIYAASGRSIFTDGGLRFLVLDAENGELIRETILDDRDPESGERVEFDTDRTRGTEVARSDILVCDGSQIYMRSKSFTMEGEPLETNPGSVEQPIPGVDFLKSGHLDLDTMVLGMGPDRILCPAGFLDDDLWHRNYWVYGDVWTIHSWGADYGHAYLLQPAGRILSVDRERIYSYGRMEKTVAWSTPMDYALFAFDKDYRIGMTGKKQSIQWQHEIPVYVTSMVKTDNNLIVTGFPTVGKETEYARAMWNESTKENLRHYRESFEGEHGGILMIIDPATGKHKYRMDLPSLPKFDGMAFAYGKTYLACVNGEVLCLE